MEYARVAVVLDEPVKADKKMTGVCDFDCTPTDIRKKYELK